MAKILTEKEIKTINDETKKKLESFQNELSCSSETLNNIYKELQNLVREKKLAEHSIYIVESNICSTLKDIDNVNNAITILKDFSEKGHMKESEIDIFLNKPVNVLIKIGRKVKGTLKRGCGAYGKYLYELTMPNTLCYALNEEDIINIEDINNE